MQRQSLGSPASKLHFHGGSLPKHDDDAEGSALSPHSSLLLDCDDRRLKTAKSSRRLSSSASSSSSSSPLQPTPTPEKLVHLIPVILLFCFLVLYLVSHNPSQSNSPDFIRLKHAASIEIDSAVTDSELGELKAGEVIMPIRSFRNLQETAGRDRRRMSSSHHRKFAGL
ncbi:unnamed protein product [Linum tenue]|uniref:Uncharacterized protein n=1 Tax=Linum tenue TaxID=586396 RepID=A0AAV0KB83_9ROSI|nr:unnamed protein product [Linum tenue]